MLHALRMSKLIITKTGHSDQIKRQYAANSYTIREYFRTAVVCKSIKLSDIPEQERLNYLRSVLTSELSPKCKSVIEEQLHSRVPTWIVAVW
ncbi:unnamed protein product [Adineta steineri]|uniref:Uncharacterized protein n=1 Tax=Adineta steineri TaxID=433720 RepID=A0A815PHA1_9BILA|nr:unnamed protein product [Adineta steineri]CAF3692320.1 unnamed protein product [Adineta steineri]